MSDSNENTSGIDFDALVKTFTELLVECGLLLGEDVHKHADLCVGVTAIKDRWELLFRPTLDLRHNRDRLIAPFEKIPGAAKGAEDVIDAALFGMESMMELLRQDFYTELQRIKPLIIAANASKP